MTEEIVARNGPLGDRCAQLSRAGFGARSNRSAS